MSATATLIKWERLEEASEETYNKKIAVLILSI